MIIHAVLFFQQCQIYLFFFFLQKLTLKDLAEKCHLPTKIFHFKYIKY